MSAIRDLVVHVNDEVVSSHAVGLATSLATEWGARSTAVLVAAPVNAGLGLSAETASLAQQLEQAQRASLLGIGERLTAVARQRHELTVELRFTDGDPVAALQAHARTADLLITAQRDPGRDGGLSTGQSARLLVGCACPVLRLRVQGRSAELSARAGAGQLGAHRRLEQLAACGTRDRQYTGMGDAPLDGYGVEMLFDRVDRAHMLHLVP